MILLGVVLFIAVVLVGGAILFNQANPPSGSAAAVAQLPPAASGLTVKPNPPNAEKGGRAWGPAGAPIKIVEFLDYQCPACGQFTKQYDKAVVDAFAPTGKVRFEFVALSFIDTFQGGTQESRDAGQSVYCAADQDKFWQMHYAIFDKQSGENRGAFSRPRLKEIARAVGLDGATFDACLDSNKYASQMDENSKLAQTIGVNSTPSFVVNGKLYTGFKNVNDFRAIFKEVAPDVTVP